LPFRGDLQPESEDSLCGDAEQSRGAANDCIVWIRLPNISNSQDCQPWLTDSGVSVRWASKPSELVDAKAIVIPGSKNTIADLQWLHETGFVEAIKAMARRGVPVVGICGGYQMLGERVCDPDGLAGSEGSVPGLSLLPVQTWFSEKKQVNQVSARWGADEWIAYEIHMGRTDRLAHCETLLTVNHNGDCRNEGSRSGKVWGTYLHGLFESTSVRSELAKLAGIAEYRPTETPWHVRKEAMYDEMATMLEQHLDLEGIWNYVAG
jgi:adenosylcobyric acid synthase